MTPFAAARGFGATLVFAGLLAASASKAEIEKFMQQCDGASIAIPEGWIEDKEASNYFKAQMLLPKGLDFEKAPAKIYAIVRYNRDKKPISDFLSDSMKDWKSRAKDATISKLDDLPRGDRPPFLRHTFEARSLKEQGYELQAVTTDGDKDGNQFVVTITLSANSEAALKAAEPAYLAILAKY
jgi:hypothetical protein